MAAKCIFSVLKGIIIWFQTTEGELTPEFVVVGAAACLSAAVSCLTQVSAVSFGPGTVPWSPQQGQAATRVVLHHTPASLGFSPTPQLSAQFQLLAAVNCGTANTGQS